MAAVLGHWANKATNYYEIDLEEALARPIQVKALKYWWLFFRRRGLHRLPRLTLLQQVGASYAKGLGERLKDRIFKTIFPHFARGFISTASQRGLRQSERSRPATMSLTPVFRGHADLPLPAAVPAVRREPGPAAGARGARYGEAQPAADQGGASAEGGAAR